MKTTFSCLLALMIPSVAASAGGRRVAQVQVVPFQTLFLVAPPAYYGTPQYTPPAAAKAVESDDDKVISALTKIVAALAALEERMNLLDGHTGVSSLPPAPGPEVPLVVLQNCAKCHTAPEARGGFDLSMLGDPRKALMAEAMVANGKMPLNSDDEPIDLTPVLRKQLIDTLEGMKE